MKTLLITLLSLSIAIPAIAQSSNKDFNIIWARELRGYPTDVPPNLNIINDGSTSHILINGTALDDYIQGVVGAFDLQLVLDEGNTSSTGMQIVTSDDIYLGKLAPYSNTYIDMPTGSGNLTLSSQSGSTTTLNGGFVEISSFSDIISISSNEYVRITSDSLSMQSKKITQLADPVNPSDAVTLNYLENTFSPFDCGDLELGITVRGGGDLNITKITCGNPSVLLTATSNQPSNYTWTGSASGSLGSAAQINVTTPQTVTLSSSECPAVTEQFIVTANITSPSVTVDQIPAVGGVVLRAMSPGSDPNMMSFYWTGTPLSSERARGATIMVDQAGTYSVTGIVDTTGCSNTEVVVVTLDTVNALGVDIVNVDSIDANTVVTQELFTPQITNSSGDITVTPNASSHFNISEGGLEIAEAEVISPGRGGSFTKLVSGSEIGTTTSSIFDGLLVSQSGWISGRSDGINDLTLVTNAYFDGAWRYKTTGEGGARFSLKENGSFIFETSPSASGTAGNSFSWNSSMFLENQTGNVGIGTSSPSAKLHSLSTTEQLRLGYDASNYMATTVASDGGVTFNATGSGTDFTFSDPVIVLGDLEIGGNSGGHTISRLVVEEGALNGNTFITATNQSTVDQFIQLGIAGNTGQISVDNGDGLAIGSKTDANQTSMTSWLDFTSAGAATFSGSINISTGDLDMGGVQAISSARAATLTYVSMGTGSIEGSNYVIDGASGGATFSGDVTANNIELVTEISLSSSQILNCNTSPVELISAPGSGNAIVVHQAVCKLTYGTTTYATGSIGVYYGTSLSAATLSNFDFPLESTASAMFRNNGLNSAGSGNELHMNESIVFYQPASDPTAGNGTAKIKIWYTIESL